LREYLNASLALCDLLQQFQPMRMPERLCDRRKLDEQRLLGVLASHHIRKIIQFNT